MAGFYFRTAPDDEPPVGQGGEPSVVGSEALQSIDRESPFEPLSTMGITPNGRPDAALDTPAAVSVDWVPHARKHPSLKQVAAAWSRERVFPTDDALAQIQLEVWVGLQRMQPMPHIAVAQVQQQPLGVLCGFRNQGGSYFYIDRIALHPGLCAPATGGLWRNAAGRDICEQLVEAAIDFSHTLGYHGWVACSPLEGTNSDWHQLRFYRHDELTYRRMGYFS